MRHRMFAGAFVVAVLAVTGAVAGDALKSGPQVGQNFQKPFNVLNVTGKNAGKSLCLVWQNGGNPVAMIFAREVSDNLTSLVKKIDAETAKNKKAKMGSYVVFISSDEKLNGALKSLAEKEAIKSTILSSMETPAGPEGYSVAKNADITVVLYNKNTVAANYAFKKGELNAAAIDKIMADVPKILPAKK